MTISHPPFDRLADLAEGLFDVHTASKPRATGIMERLVGIMRFDSAHAAPAFGLRVGADEASRQLLFDAQPYELELRTRPMAGGWSVTGQLLGPAETVDYGEVELIGQDARVHAPLSELLEFSFPAVPSGTYRLELRFDDARAIEIPSLELGT